MAVGHSFAIGQTVLRKEREQERVSRGCKVVTLRIPSGFTRAQCGFESSVLIKPCVVGLSGTVNSQGS